jgi:hypothetical protein
VSEPYGDDLERWEEAQDPTELLERAVVAEVDDVRAEVVDGCIGADGLERRSGTLVMARWRQQEEDDGWEGCADDYWSMARRR